MNAGDEFFDASQYAFFGGNVSDEVELGGLDEEDGGEQLEDGEESNDGLAERDVSSALIFNCIRLKRYVPLHAFTGLISPRPE